MSRTSIVTVGMLSVLLGIQLNLVDSFVLTPRATRFWQSKLGNFGSGAGQLQNSVAGYAGGISNGVSNGSSNRAGSYLPSTGFGTQSSPYSSGLGNQQYGQYSRSYARNNYPFNTPNYTSRPSALPSYQGSGTTGFGGLNGTPAIQAGFANNNQAKPFASFTNGVLGPQKVITPPKWISWASIFLGAVLFIYGAAKGRG